MKISCQLFIYLIIFLTFNSSTLATDENPKKLNKPAGSPSYTKLNINNISTWIYNNGDADIELTGNSGFVFPKGSGKAAIFESGFLWGGKINNQTYVGGSAYRSGLQPGKILSPGTAEDPNLPKNRIYRVRPDYKTGDLWNEISDEYSDYWTIFNQYEKDWNEWPVNDGAPFDDLNSNGIYEPLIDIPGIKGANQTIWYVANDLDAGLTNFMYGSSPMGIEMQVTIWGYSNKGSLSDLIFKKYKLINKRNTNIDSMYVSIWSDPDVGLASDDYIGCDTLLNLGYAYNATNNDVVYGNYPPAVGFGLLQGPIVSGLPTDTATFNGRKINGKKNLSMSAFYYFTQGDITVVDPIQGDYNGTLQFYNFFQGKVGLTGEYFLHPNGVPTRYALSGDPVAGRGWIDGQLISADDRRMGLSFGPFQMAPSDTQEVIFTQIAEIGSQRADANINNIIPLKRKQMNIRNFIKNGVAIDVTGDNLIPINRTIMLNSSYLFINPSQSINSYAWQLLSKPAGSNALLSGLDIYSSTFSADLEGNYIIGLTLNTSLGYSATGYIEITATSIKPPTAKFNFEKDEITWGDSVIVDGTESVDPQSQKLNYYWNGDGIINPINNGDKIEFFPIRAGSITLDLQISNDYFFSEIVSNSITVHPRINNITTQYSFADPENVWGVCFQGDTLLGMISEQNKIKIYDITENGFIFKRYIDVPGLAPSGLEKIIGIKNDKLFVLANSQEGFFGVGALFLFSVGNDWQITPILQNYKPADLNYGDIRNIEFDESGYALVRDRYGIYLIDFFSNPSTPIIVKQYTHHQLSGITVQGHRSNESYIYLNAWDNIAGTNFIEVLDRNSLSFIGNINFTKSIRDFIVKDNYLIASYQGNDTIDVFDITNLNVINKIKSFLFQVPVHWLTSDYSYFRFVNEELFAIISRGITFFKFDDILDPKPVASWYDGTGKYITYNNGMYYLIPTDMRWYPSNQESGINRITLDIAVNIADYNINIPQAFSISQNYPNPFNPVTKIKYSIPQRSFVAIKIYDVLGKEVTTLVNEEKQSGNHEVEFNASNFSSGVYFYRMQAGDFTDTKKILLMK